MKGAKKPSDQRQFDQLEFGNYSKSHNQDSKDWSLKNRTPLEKLLLAVTVCACIAAIGWANRPRPIEKLGLIQLHQGDYAQASETLKQAQGLHGESVESYLGLAQAANKRGQYLDALKYADEALSFYQSEPSAWAERAEAHLGMQNYRQAIRDAQQALSIQPHHKLAQIVQNRAIKLLAQHEPESGH